MSLWLLFVLGIAALSVTALLAYLRRSAKAGDCVLVAHGLILLIGLALAGAGVLALKFLSI